MTVIFFLFLRLYQYIFSDYLKASVLKNLKFQFPKLNFIIDSINLLY